MEIEQENTGEVVENAAPEQTEEVVETPSPGEGEGEAAAEETPEALAEAAGKQEAESTEGEEKPEGEEEEIEETPEFKPNFKFKAGVFNKETKQLEQKDFDIDPKFHAIMKDADSEKLVRELHEKAYGLQSVKERFDIARQENQEITQENRSIRNSIEGLKSIYQGAVKSGNWHKLDNFFAKMSIPQEHILQYAMAKVKLHEMPEEQRNAVLGQLKSENDAEAAAQQQQLLAEENAQNAIKLKNMEVDHTLASAAVDPLAKAYDDRVGKPGAFRDLVMKEGQLAWATEGVNLTAGEAVKRVIEHHGLATGKHGLPPVQQPAATPPAQTVQPNPQQRTVVKKKAPTIPNLQGRTTSPLAGKPKNLDEILKYRKANHGF